jgi:hypothetical protein
LQPCRPRESAGRLDRGVHSRKLATSSAWSGGGLPGVDGNLLYHGDNLDVLRRHIKDESVDLVDLDPPFNSNTSYKVLICRAWHTIASADSVDGLGTALLELPDACVELPR